jgi:hypothetical protein
MVNSDIWQKLKAKIKGVPSHLNEDYSCDSIVYFIACCDRRSAGEWAKALTSKNKEKKENAANGFCQGIKIGTTSRMTRRIEELQISTPGFLYCVYWFYGSFKEETILHKYFNAGNIQGEWFSLETVREYLGITACDLRTRGLTRSMNIGETNKYERNTP